MAKKITIELIVYWDDIRYETELEKGINNYE